MSEEAVCHICGKTITDPKEQVDRNYVFVRHPAGPRLEGRRFPVRKHHDACDEVFAREKTHLKKVTEA